MAETMPYAVALDNLNIMITGTHWSPLSSSLPSFSLYFMNNTKRKEKKRKEVKTKQAVPYDCLVLELLQWIYYVSLWILPTFFFSNANALPPFHFPHFSSLNSVVVSFSLSVVSVSSFCFALMLGRIDLLMLSGIKLGRFATRYDGIFYKRNRI